MSNYYERLRPRIAENESLFDTGELVGFFLFVLAGAVGLVALWKKRKLPSGFVVFAILPIVCVQLAPISQAAVLRSNLGKATIFDEPTAIYMMLEAAVVWIVEMTILSLLFMIANWRRQDLLETDCTKFPRGPLSAIATMMTALRTIRNRLFGSGAFPVVNCKCLLPFLWSCGISLVGAAGLVWEKDSQELKAPMDGEANVEARFSFANRGTTAIRILGVKTSCGCVAAATSKDLIAPGEKGEIVAKFAFGGRVGQQEKTVVVQMDDSTEPVKVLGFRMFIPQLVRIEPALLLWRIGENPEPKKMIVNVEAGVEIGELTATSSSAEVDARLEKEKAGGQYRLVVTPKRTDVPQTAFIRVGTRGKDSRAFIAHVCVK